MVDREEREFDDALAKLDAMIIAVRQRERYRDARDKFARHPQARVTIVAIARSTADAPPAIRDAG